MCNQSALRCFIEYCFKKETIKRFVTYIKEIVTTVVVNPQTRICDIKILIDKEKRQLLHDFNNQTAEYPQNKTIHELIVEQARKNPDSVAVIAPSRYATGRYEPGTRTYTITYKELNKKSDLLVYSLRQKGIQFNSIVTIMVESSLEMIIGMLGILKAGGAYLPINPGNPPERIKYLLEDTNTKIILTGQDIADLHSPKAFNHHPNVIMSQLHQTQWIQSYTNHLAYIIYTSGTTGKPKGTILSHQNLLNYVHWFSTLKKKIILVKLREIEN